MIMNVLPYICMVYTLMYTFKVAQVPSVDVCLKQINELWFDEKLSPHVI